MLMQVTSESSNKTDEVGQKSPGPEKNTNKNYVKVYNANKEDIMWKWK